MSSIPFFRHDLGEPELNEIAKVFEGNILTTGSKVSEFEDAFSCYLGVQETVGVTSCTAALQLSLSGYDIGPGDEVITTPMSFIATATAIIQAGAKPVFVDVEEKTGNIDISKIEKAITSKTKAIVPVHLFGQMCDMKAMRVLADGFGLRIFEDAAHCIEGQREGIRPGQIGDTACFSFYATKNMTCGEGGAVVCKDPEIAKRLSLLRSHGMDKVAADREREGYSHWDMPEFGWKYNMDNIQAAMLIPQMDRLAQNLEKRTNLVDRYVEGFRENTNITLFGIDEGVVHSHHLMPIRVPGNIRDLLIAALAEKGIGAMVNYRPIHLFSYFRNKFGYTPGMFPVAELIGDTVLSLPLYPNMPPEHVDIVTLCINEYCSALE